MEVISIPAVSKVKNPLRTFSVFSDVSKYRDPIHLLLEYIADVSTSVLSFLPTILTWAVQQASDCDMVLAHDNDLLAINGIGDDTVSEPLNSSYVVLLMFAVTGNSRTGRDDGSPSEVQHRGT
jgi:hypothetical protein